MKVLFLTLGKLDSINSSGIYTDMLRCFAEKGHEVYAVGANEKRSGKPTTLSVDLGVNLLNVKIGNITKCGLIEKGISTLQIESKYKKAIKKYFKSVKFDLILYSTPPITFAKVVEYVKKRDNATTYLILKDIFPQNAVDIGVLRKSGLKGVLYKFFRRKEKNLYKLSDKIGCMSQANVDYVLANNPEVDKNKVEISPNSIEVVEKSITIDERVRIRQKYDLPNDKKIFVYGGNLGKPQGIPFILECLRSQKDSTDKYFLIVGNGTEYDKVESFAKESNQQNFKLLKYLPVEDYDLLVSACDVGMIFLDHRFTIPNFPSRLLSYMQAKLPVLACTDDNTDIGKVILEGRFGWWGKSDNVQNFVDVIKSVDQSDLNVLGENGFKYLIENYSIDKSVDGIISSVSKGE